MLVLSRKVGERIQIGDGIVVEVRRVAGNRVTIAVEAPREMRILRGELVEAATAFRDAQTETRVNSDVESTVVLAHSAISSLPVPTPSVA